MKNWKTYDIVLKSLQFPRSAKWDSKPVDEHALSDDTITKLGLPYKTSCELETKPWKHLPG